MKYKNLGGKHIMVDGTVIKHGDVFEGDEQLGKLFINKFERLHEDPPTIPETVEAAESVVTPVPTSENATQANVVTAAAIVVPVEEAIVTHPQLTEGRVDVTTEYPKAIEAKLLVVKDKQGLWVYDDDALEAINDKPLKTSKAVDKVIAQYLVD